MEESAGEEGPEFPEELDEFLQYCVEEHGEDFEAISHDFMDIASELEGELVERAHEFFSPEALRLRWCLLNGEDPGPPEPAKQAAPAAAPAAPVASPAEGAATAGSSSLDSSSAMLAESTAENVGMAPSNFSIFRDSLKDQIDKIYSDVQNRLPTTLDADDDEDNSDEEVKIFTSEPQSGGQKRSLTAATETSGADKSTSGETAERSVEEAAAAASPSEKMDLLNAASLDGDLRQRTLELFGTDDLSEIFPELPSDALPSDTGVADSPQAASPVGGQSGLPDIPSGLLAGLSATQARGPPAGLGPQGGGGLKAPSSELPSFDAVLLSHGVNPQDIDGPMVELPNQVKEVFDKLKQGLDEGRDFSGPAGAGTAVAAAKERQTPPPSPQAARAPKPQQLAQQRSTTPAGEGDGKGSAKSSGKGSATAAGKGKGKGSAEASGDEASEDATEDSADEDFAAMRRNVKTDNLQFASKQDAEGNSPSQKSLKFTPPTRPARSSPPKPAASPSGQKFVKLELIESSEEDIEEEDEDQEESASADEDGNDDDVEALGVMRRLLRRAPSGECQWDVWLDATRKYPRLQLLLGGSPTFFRRDGDLKVSFDVEKLRSVLDEQIKEHEERKRKEAEEAERHRLGLTDYVAEAERRREQLRARLGDGFVLTSRSRVLEEKFAQTQKKKQEKEEEKERERQEQERREKEKQEREKEKQRKREEARLQQEQEQEQERLRLKREADARGRELRIEEIAKQVQRHRCPLYERHVSHGPVLPGVSEEAQEFLDSAPGSHSGDKSFMVYAIPWGIPDRGLTAPSTDQGQLLSLLCAAEGLVQAMLLVKSDAMVDAGGDPEVARGCVAVVLMLLDIASASGLLTTALPSGQVASAVLSGPLPLESLGRFFTRPLALWADDHSADAAGTSQAPVRCSAETVCIALRPGASRLAAVLAEVHQEGLAVVGMRMAFANEAVVQTLTSVALRGALQPGRGTLLIAIRGPQALSLWRNLLGPADPQLARHTDPSSLNARFGGQGRSEAIALNPPSSAAKAFTDVVWAFGGRVDPESPALPQNPVCAVLLSIPAVYAARISGHLTFANAGSMLHGVLVRGGDVQNVMVDGTATSSGLVVTAVREGGGDFLEACTRLLGPASENGSCESPPVKASLCEVPRLTLSAPSSKALYEQAYQFGEPEVLVVGFRPRVTNSPAFREACEGLHAKFGSGGLSTDGRTLPPSLCVGSSVDLLAVRLIDFSSAGSAGSAAPLLHAAGIEVLREFRSFMQVVRRAPDNASDTWWASSSSAGRSSGPAAFVCLRGEALISRFVTFLSKEWKLPAAVAGDVFFSPTPRVAFSAYTALFAGISCPAPFEPTVPRSDLRAEARFCSAREAKSLSLTEAALFPQRGAPQLTAAVLLPPFDDWFLARVLSSAEQSGFTLQTAVVSGGLREDTARVIFDQEVADGHLEADEWEAFQAAAGCDADDEEGQFKSVWLVLSRHQGVKRFAQLCGDANPAVNHRYLKATLRQPPRDRLHNGIRCATSCATATALLGQLAVDLQPRLRSPSAGGRLGIEAGAGRPSCVLVAVALVEADAAGPGLIHVLRELANMFSERGLALVGLRAVAGSTAGARKEEHLDAASAASSPQASASEVEAMKRWKEMRQVASRLANIATEGGSVILAACEGSNAPEHGRAAVLKAAANVSASSGGDATGPEIYSSATAAEGAADVAHFFSDLFGAKHYIVASDLD